MAVRITVRKRLWILLGLSLVLRVALALQGGQLFFPDENRYFRGMAIYQGLRAGNFGMVAEAVQTPDHLAFSYVSALAAAIQHGLAQFTASNDWSGSEGSHATLPLAASVLSIFSVLNIWLVYRLARAAGADDPEALWAALLMAASNILFFHARHLQPYDCSLSAALAGLWLGMTPGSRGRWLAGGMMSALCFQIYNGYWFLAPVILGNSLAGAKTWQARGRVLANWTAGFIVAMATMFLPGAIAGGNSFWKALLVFSDSALQGFFAEGWSLPWEYLWHSEGWIAGAVLAGIVLATTLLRQNGTDVNRPKRWLILLLAVYLLLVIGSVFLEKFVIYGRTVRPTIPLACLAAACGLHGVIRLRPLLGPWLAGSIMVAAAIGFAPHYYQVFPRETRLHVAHQHGRVKQVVSFGGGIYEPLSGPGAPNPALALANAQLLYPVRDYLGYPAGEELFSVAHPAAQLAYQYEGLTPRERTLIRQHVPAIKLIRLSDSNSLPYDPPRSLLITGADLADGRDSRP